MRTWGLDLSTDPAKTGLVSVDWANGGRVEVCDRRHRTLEALVERIAETAGQDERPSDGEHWAVDVPFGWPVGFGGFLIAHQKGPAAVAKFGREMHDDPHHPWFAVRNRVTDRRVGKRTRLHGLSVSFDKLGATAAMWSAIEHGLSDRGVTIDRSGTARESRIVETWPTAAWRCWAETYAPTPPRDWQSMRKILLPLLDITDVAESELSSAGGHARDALVCALVARAHALGQTAPPEDSDLVAARQEGWIHLPGAGQTLGALAGQPDEQAR